jgi:hypothetical protein
MKALTTDMETEAKDRIRGIYEVDNKLDELKDTMKTYNASKKEMFKALSELLEVGVNSLKRGYKAYVDSIKDPASVNESDYIFAMIKEHDLLKQEKKA